MKKRLLVKDVQAQVDDLRAQVNYWVDACVELQAQVKRLDDISEVLTWGESVTKAELLNLREEVCGLDVKTCNHDWLIDHHGKVLAVLDPCPRPSLFRRFLSLFKA